MYASGILVERDLNEAVRWNLKAAKQGHPMAQFRVGELFHQCIRENRIEAYKWLLLSAAKDKKLEAHARFLTSQIRIEMTNDMVAEAEKRVKEWEPKS